ncbi:DEAD/DEAH box helicase [Spiroplasma platyhelix]|uniref:DEAD/DEAH box helicase n=1 Tax=Spiroplasma platyhelix PALS-1 TaxID=1276218 RepID=A0A846TWI0_9MOLU|nr:DEAD/DEAH box helicase [Spiroplasma platyhelix]MBE4703999.1 DEAD-box ATP-dependent RNA helicase CshE [Spiroplasma platyhelix PALS-1]NKE38371.1 DEAD/DEAH box helicase [Spiroplasma platyhelix PALS-1]UJB29257.1 ATP-dependent RNA helicase DeaD [Spiroplasma platyhelix PALS-1]
MNFNELNLKKELNLAIANLGHTTPTPIQNLSIPVILQNRDIFGKSHTGTGKTAAFVLPILNMLDTNVFKNQTLIVCPTRDLSIQIYQEIKKYAMYLKNVRIALLVGGSSMSRQLSDLRSSNIVVGTPGRIVDHINRRTLKLGFLKTIVLDEADEMLKMGFKEKIDEIFSAAPDNTQTVLFSATISKPILKITADYQTNPVAINLNNELQTQEDKNIKQFYFDTKNNHKEKALIALYKELNPKLSIIFSNTKAYTNKLQDLLKQNGIDSVTITGDKRQRERELAMKQFKSGKVNVLIATDLVARGIHVDGIDYIFNFDIPREKEYYTHRIGRTARAGATGTAITLVRNKNDYFELKNIEKLQDQPINKLEIESNLLDFKEYKENRDTREPRGNREYRSNSEYRGNRDSRSNSEYRGNREPRSNSEYRGNRDSRDTRNNKDSREPRKFKDFKKFKNNNSRNYSKRYN